MLSRRSLLKSGSCAAAALACAKTMRSEPAFPIIDTHIHLFDPTRPGGIPWPEPSDTVLYQRAMPDRYEHVSAGSGVVGAIAIEASPLPNDNDWLLAVAGANPFIVGVIGDLVPGSPQFAGELERLHQNPLFVGLRYGNLWNRNLAIDLNRPGFLDSLKLLAQSKLVFESANPDPPLMWALAEIAERVPDLTIVIDHLPHATQPADATEKMRYLHSLRTLGSAPRVFAKLSEIPLETNGKVKADPSLYRNTLDELWDIFGEDRVLFGSDWPNSDHVLPFSETLGILRSYAAGKSRIAQQKLFWRNSIHAYRWQKRLANQPV